MKINVEFRRVVGSVIEERLVYIDGRYFGVVYRHRTGDWVYSGKLGIFDESGVLKNVEDEILKRYAAYKE